MAFSDNFIYELKLNNPIEVVMSSYVTVKSRGRSSLCLCPFHSEKTPSCNISVERQYFHCFGCSAGGDVITFIMKIENLSYPEAVRFLAKRAGMKIPDDKESEDASNFKARIYEINRAAAKYFHENLTKSPAGEKGRRYFAERQLSVQTIRKYGLGYAPNEWGNLRKFLSSHGFSDDEMISANLCARSQKGNVYDVFRDRAIFPIIDIRGNVVAFGGRVIDGDGPKYLNTSDTSVFKKSRNLFSLNFAKKDNSKRLILAEGYMDVIAVNQAGFENVVATLGTALTPEQARLMKQYADEVVIAYDSDNAGQNATHKAINLLSEVGIATKIIKMENAKDPDEYIKINGALRFKQLIERSDGAINFELVKAQNGIDLDSDDGKIKYINKCIGIIAEINSPLEREMYAVKIAKQYEISREVILNGINKKLERDKKTANKKQNYDIQSFSNERREDPEFAQNMRASKAERGIIYFISKYPDKIVEIARKLSPDKFVTSFNRKIYELILKKSEKSYDFDIMSLQSELSADEMGKITKIIAKGEEIPINSAVLDDYISILNSYVNPEEQAKNVPLDELNNYFNNLKIEKK